MHYSAIAIVAVALVACVLGLTALCVRSVVETRVLVVGFLIFFLVSLVFGAGLVPMSPGSDATTTRSETDFASKAN